MPGRGMTRTNLARARVRNTGVVEELHPDGIARRYLGDVGLCGIAERAQVATKIVVVGCQIVKSVGELGRLVADAASGLTNVLPVRRSLSVQHELAEDIMSGSRRCQTGSDCNGQRKILHCVWLRIETNLETKERV